MLRVSARWSRPRASYARDLRFVVLAVVAASFVSCRKPDEPIVAEFKDSFDRAEIGSSWQATGGDYQLVRGEIDAKRLDHHPIWLRRRLPRDVEIEFDARPESDDGDIRVVLFGDGRSVNPDGEGCESSGYLLAFGGWKNTLSVLCRERQVGGGHERARSDWPVVRGRTYHYYITRQGDHIEWYIDGIQMTAWADSRPLVGEGHDHFAFDGGRAEVFFDNLVITPMH